MAVKNMTQNSFKVVEKIQLQPKKNGNKKNTDT